jgi:hypothetical protein
MIPGVPSSGGSRFNRSLDSSHRQIVLRNRTIEQSRAIPLNTIKNNEVIVKAGTYPYSIRIKGDTILFYRDARTEDDSPRAIRTFTSSLTVGRVPREIDYCNPTDDRLSGRHFSVKIKGPDLIITDHRSSNGTTIEWEEKDSNTIQPRPIVVNGAHNGAGNAVIEKNVKFLKSLQGTNAFCNLVLGSPGLSLVDLQIESTGILQLADDHSRLPLVNVYFEGISGNGKISTFEDFYHDLTSEQNAIMLATKLQYNLSLG